MIQLNMRITNKSTQKPSQFGLGDTSKYPTLNQAMVPRNFAAGRLQIMTNYVEPIFRIEKIKSNALTSQA